MSEQFVFLQNPWENKLLDLASEVEEEMIIICPFIKETVLKDIIASLGMKKLKILLRTNVFDISNNSFDFECFNLLRSSKTEIRTIKNLHAKLFMFDNKRAVITSSNLTKSGLNLNIEFGILIEDNNFIDNNILPIVSQYWLSAQKVTDVDIENIKTDLSKFERFKSGNNRIVKPSKNQHKPLFVKPKGTDAPKRKIELSNNQKLRIVANTLMLEDLNADTVYSQVKNIITDVPIRKVLRNAVKYSFMSEDPFYTASTYYRNAEKVYPRIGILFYESNVKTFKNMIMEMGNTNIKIKTPEEYFQIQTKYMDSFEIEPPNSVQIFDQIIKDKSCFNKMVNDINLFFRLKSLFADIKASEIESLKKALLDKLNANLAYKKDRMKLKDNVNDLKKISQQINQIEENIGLLNKTPKQKKVHDF